MGAVDAPGALLPNGNVLCVVGPTGTPGEAEPTFFFEFDPATLSLTPAPAPAIAGTSPTLQRASPGAADRPGDILCL
jgi:hypothetical protein